MIEFRKWLESNLGERLYKQKGIWMIPFNDVEKDPSEGYYFDYGSHQTGGSISNLSKVKEGDKVSDVSANMTPYWVVSGVDEDKQHIYLTPIKPNPLVTGVGAGGKVLDDFDMSVFTGEYEKKRVDQVLQLWKSGIADNISDIAYVLLGTVPVNFGPNGAQGGWYDCTDSACRGRKRGMSAQEVMMQDAKTVRDQFKFSVPSSAISGNLDPRAWNNFVQGSPDIEKDTKLDEEDFDDPKTLVKMILKHPMPAIKLRNTERLIDLYKGYYKFRSDQKTLRHLKYSDLESKWKSGGYSNKSILPLIHDAAIRFSKVRSKNTHNHFDPYWNAKEKFIVFANQENWMDVLESFETAPDKTNRRYVFDAYLERKDKNRLKRMLDRETSAEALNSMLTDAIGSYRGFGHYDYSANIPKGKVQVSFIVQYIVDNYEELVRKANNASDKGYYQKDLIDMLTRVNEIQGMDAIVDDQGKVLGWRKKT